MSTKDQNLSRLPDFEIPHPERIQLGLVYSEWNKEITSSLTEGAYDALAKYGIGKHQVKAIGVPGSFEITSGAKLLINAYSLEAIICLGCVIKGETTHNEYINHAVAEGLTRISTETGIPCVFGLLTTNDKQQAMDRAGGKYGNKGAEAAYTALRMAVLRRNLLSTKQKIGF
jgi:6,7-dimethyl-8-ribityllumazine synthase